MIRGMRQFMKEPTTNELRNPVSLVKSVRVPDGGDGYVTQLIKQDDCWAKFIAASTQPLDGESQDDATALTHVMLIRWPAAETPSIDWKVVYDNRLYAILDVQWVGQRRFFLALALNDNGPMEGRVYDRPETPQNPNDVENPEAEPAPQHDGFPFWGG